MTKAAILATAVPISAMFALAAGPALAQDAAPATQPQVGLVDEVVVTALKRSAAVSVHDAPLAVSAIGAEELERTHVRDVSDLQKMIPNVYFSSNSSMPGTNNLSIRGMAVYGSQPGATPTVGIFVDEVFQGSIVGAVWSVFDVEGVEVLRGPQGLLFGQNVTGGAILVRTSDPTSTLSVTAKASIETGPEYKASAVVSGPIAPWVNGKIAFFHGKDEGWFENLAKGGAPLGQSETTVGRLGATFFPDGPITSTLKLERGSLNGDGAPGQNQFEFGRKSFNIRNDTNGATDSDWVQASLRTTLDTDFGDGQIVYLLGYRQFDQFGESDVDGTQYANIHLRSFNDYQQLSSELRYSGTFGPVDLTVGHYVFTDELNSISGRTITNGARDITGGAIQESSSWAVFSNADWHLTDALTLTLGARYAQEKKHARVQTELTDAISPCSFITRSCDSYDFEDRAKWDAFTPKVGVQWSPDSETNLYAYYTKGFRSGGYNLRRTSIVANPGPFRQEVEQTVEVGVKRFFLDRRLNTRLAVFENKFKDIQRDVLTQDPVFGVITVSGNAGDVRIRGVEAEVTALLAPGLDVGVNAGYLENKFTKIVFDLSGNRSIGPEDYELQLPFLLPWSFGAFANYERQTPVGEVSTRVQFTWRDQGFSNDANTGWLPVVRDLTADISLTPDAFPSLTFSLFGKNLLNQPTWGYSNPSNSFPTGPTTFTPMNEGRSIGLEVRYRY